MKRWNKNRITYVHFSHSDFYDFDNFVSWLLENLNNKEQYSLLLKIKFNNVKFGMVGKQVGFKYDSAEDIDVFEGLYESLKERLENFLDDYDVEVINSIQLLVVRINDMPDLKIKNVNKIRFYREFEKEGFSKERFNFIPLTTNDSYFGKLIINGKNLYLDKINMQKVILNEDKLFNEDVNSMYLYKDSYVIINRKDENVFYRSVYNCLSGILIMEVKDEIINADHFVRKIGNARISVVKNSITNIEFEKKLSYIKYTSKPLKDEFNPFIGSWDIEAFKDLDNYAKVYALGFYTLGGNAKVYYLNGGITSEELVLQCIDDMLVNKYNGYTFYTHNFGRYDSRFLLKILKEENIRRGYEHYMLNSVCRDDKVLKLTIKVKRSFSDRKPLKPSVRKEPGFNTITITDSLNLLNQSLHMLCESFGVEVTKGKFPHSFVRRDTLNYVGDTPGISYWDNTKEDEYNKQVKPDWDLKNECLKYLEKDLISLTLIMHKFGEYVNRKYNLQVTDSLTISRLALNIFLKDYLKNTKLPIIGKSMFSDIKKAYYGGITEVYKPHGRNLFYYDVNSLYPFAALNPMPGVNCSFIENIGNKLDLNELFGYFYCKIETGDNYLGLLPLHSKEGLIMPNGEWEGWYFSEELKYALCNGYKIHVIKGYSFNKLDNVFTDYVNDLYRIKSTTKDSVEKDINKRLLNHLLGRFGMSIVKPITELVDSNKLSLITSTREIIGQPKVMTDNDYWLTYSPEIDQTLCEEHGIDYFKVCNLTSKSDVEKLNEFRDVSLTTAAAVTAYARIYMSKIKADILNRGGNLYYTDTDSIVTDIALDDNLVGSGLGQFKLEYKVKEGYFISNKTYCLQLFDKIYDKYKDEYKDFVVKSKTVLSESLTVDSFKDLYIGKDVKAIKRSAITDHSKGSVLICDDQVNLYHDSYTKREKVYRGNLWIDTRPLIVNGKDEINANNKIKPVKTNIKKKSNLINFKVNSSLLFTFTIIFYIFSLLFYTSFVVLVYVFAKADLSDLCNLDIKMDDSIDELLELRYLDDYLEEPVEIEYYKHSSYFEEIIDLFKGKGCNSNTRYSDWISSIGNFTPEVVVENSFNERPQVLTNILKYHLDISYQNINRLNNLLSLAEISRVKKDIAIWDALLMCKKALNGSPFIGGNSPFLGVDSPVIGVGQNSPFTWANPIIGQ